MIRPLLFITLAPLLSSVVVNGEILTKTSREEVKGEIAASPGKSGGIYYAYPYDTDSVPEAPEGYRPVAISHYGRHGSRWAINEKQYAIVTDVMEREEGRGNLTEMGAEVLAKVRAIAAHAKGHAGELSPLGQRQHKGIAQRMYNRTPSLFADSAQILARSSIEPRCIVSMAAFSESLKENNPKLRIKKSASPGDMDFISFSTSEAKAFTSDNAPWRKELAEFRDTVIDYSRILSTLFADPVLIGERVKFVKTLHDIAVTTQNVGLDVDLLSLFSDDELFGLWQAINYNMYVCHANSPMSEGIGMSCARSLLDNIVNDADSALNGSKEPIQLRFGHDTALIRLLALMKIDGCANAEADSGKYCEAWQDYRVSPMGANLQLIFYQNEKDPEEDPLVLILHNERPATVPLISATAPFYSWKDLKALWQVQL